MTVAAGLFCACGGPSQFSKRAGGLPGRSAYAGTAPAARPGLSARTPVPDLRSLDSGGAGRRLCAHACPRELGDGWRAGGMLPGSASRPVSPRRVACGGMRLPATPGKPRRVCRHRETDAAETAFPVTWGRGGCDHAARLHVQGTTSGRGPLPPEYRGQGEAGRQTGETGGRTAGVPGEAERCLTGDIGGRETGQPVRWLRLPDASGGGQLETLCVSNHPVCCFAENRGVTAHVWPGGAVLPPRGLLFSMAGRSGGSPFPGSRRRWPGGAGAGFFCEVRGQDQREGCG